MNANENAYTRNLNNETLCHCVLGKKLKFPILISFGRVHASQRDVRYKGLRILADGKLKVYTLSMRRSFMEY